MCREKSFLRLRVTAPSALTVSLYYPLRFGPNADERAAAAATCYLLAADDQLGLVLAIVPFGIALGPVKLLWASMPNRERIRGRLLA
jgi:hypothetical protein